MSLVSLIITTKNSAGTLEKLLVSLKAQTFKSIEIIVVDNNSSDETKVIAHKYTNKVFDKGPERSVQRNFGAKKSKGDYLLFLDSDMELSKTVVAECVEAISKTGVGAVVIPEKSFGNNFWAKVKAFERSINEGESYFEAARFFSRRTFDRYQGYSTDITGPEDWDLPKRVSQDFKIGRIKSYIFHNEGSPTPLKLAKRKYYYGLTAHVYLTKNKISTIGPQTIYFLRPAFYRNWKKLLQSPVLTLGLLVMLTFETLGGGLGYLKGKFNL